MRRPTNLWTWIAVLAAIWVFFILVHPAIDLPDSTTPSLHAGTRILQFHVVLLTAATTVLPAAYFGVQFCGPVEMLEPCRPGKVCSTLPLLC
jgi:hypothetical protein